MSASEAMIVRPQAALTRAPGLVHPRDVAYIRATSLKTFELCPHTWANRYLQPGGEQDEQRSGAAAIGTAVHTICEHFMMSLHAGAEDTPEREQALAAAWATVPPEEQDNVHAYLRFLADLPTDNVLVVEERLFHRMREDAPPISGQIDLAYETNGGGTLVIHDHKTHRSYSNRDFWACQLQQLVYAWMARREWPGYKEYRFVIGYPNLGTHVEWATDPADDKALRLRFERIWAGMLSFAAQGAWPRTINDECNWCPFKGGCSEYRRSVMEFTESFQRAAGAKPATEQLLYVKQVEAILRQVKLELEAKVREEVKAAGGSMREGAMVWEVSRGAKRVAAFGETMRALNELCAAHPERTTAVAAALDSVFTVGVGALEDMKRAVPEIDALVDRVCTRVDNKTETLSARESKEPKGIEA